MPSVAEVWLADDLAGLWEHPLPRLRADLHRFSRETGWRLSPFSATPTGGLLEVHTLESPWGDRQVEMRIHRFVPVLGFTDALELACQMKVDASMWVAWGQTYINPAPFVTWWQSAGWLVPEAAWLNAPYARAELADLDPSDARELGRHHTLSRGDALFFEW